MAWRKSFLFCGWLLAGAGWPGLAGPPEAGPAPAVDLVRIRGGEFRFRTLPARFPAAPPLTVRIKDFYLGRTEVTVGLWKRFVSQTGFVSAAETEGGWVRIGGALRRVAWASWKNPGYPQGDDHPVALVTWNDVQAFLIWISRVDNRPYRLPTEAEWQYACRAGDGPVRYGPLDRIAWMESNSAGHAHEAGRLQPNPWGLYDMLGNVWEWCAGGEETLRPSCGGSWCSKPPRVRADFRRLDPAGFCFQRLGFRLARDGR